MVVNLGLIDRIQIFLKDKNLELILKGAQLSFISKIISVLLGLWINFIIANLYGADIVGTLSLIMSIILMASLVTTFGMQDAIIKLIFEFKNKYNIPFFKVYEKTLKVSLCLTVLVSLILIFFNDFIAIKIFGKENISSFITYIAFLLLFYTIHLINSATVRSLKRIKTFAIFEILPNLMMLLCMLFLTYLSNYMYIPIYAYLLSIFLLFIISSLVVVNIVVQEKEKLVGEYIKEQPKYKIILKTSFPMMLTSSMFIVASQVDIFMLGILKSTSDVGVYAIANKIAIIVTFITVAINSMIAPEFSDLYNKNKIQELQYVSQKSTKLIFFATIPIILLLILLGKYILGIFGSVFITGYTVLLLLLLGQSINALLGSTGNFLNMTNNQNKLMMFVSFSLILNIILNYLFIPIYGINGAAFATMVSVIVWNVLATLYIYKKFGFVILYNPFKRFS